MNDRRGSRPGAPSRPGWRKWLLLCGLLLLAAYWLRPTPHIAERWPAGDIAVQRLQMQQQTMWRLNRLAHQQVGDMPIR